MFWELEELCQFFRFFSFLYDYVYVCLLVRHLANSLLCMSPCLTRSLCFVRLWKMEVTPELDSSALIYVGCM